MAWRRWTWLVPLGLFATMGCDAAKTNPSLDAARDTALGDGGSESDGDNGTGGDGPQLTSCNNSVGVWQAMADLDHVDCASRPLIPCFSSDGTTATSLEFKLLQFAREICRLPAYHWLRVDFVSGCPSTMAAKSTGPDLPSGLVDCLTRALATERWSCAVERTCAMVEYDTLALP